MIRDAQPTTHQILPSQESYRPHTFPPPKLLSSSMNRVGRRLSGKGSARYSALAVGFVWWLLLFFLASVLLLFSTSSTPFEWWNEWGLLSSSPMVSSYYVSRSSPASTELLLLHRRHPHWMMASAAHVEAGELPVTSTTITTAVDDDVAQARWKDQHYRSALLLSAERRQKKKTEKAVELSTASPSPQEYEPLLRWYRCTDSQCDRSSCRIINTQPSGVCIRHPSGFYMFAIYRCTRRGESPDEENKTKENNNNGFDMVQIEIYPSPLCTPEEKSFSRDQDLNECLFNGGEKQGNYEILECS